jgi:cytosine/adenosine deaminase-related metal-dependent hydrolase
MLQAGVRVALGTDSRASNPDLDLLGELRFIARQQEAIAPEPLLRMSTLSGAEALGLADYCGSITAGKSGRLAVVPLADGKQLPLEAILFSEQKCQPLSAG